MRELAVADADYWFGAAVPLGLARITDATLDGYLKLVAWWQGAADGVVPSSGPYLRGSPSMALDAQAQLEALAGQIRGSQTLREQVTKAPAAQLLTLLRKHPEGQAVADEIQHYLDRYGHQMYNLDFAAPTQADDPTPVLLSLQAAVTHPDRDVRAHQAELARERETLVGTTERSLSPPARWLFRLPLGWAQRYTPHREAALFFVGAAWPALRRLAPEARTTAH